VKVLHEDEDHIVIDKAPGHPVVARGRGGEPCLYDALLALLNEGVPDGGPYVRPHIVHRLDRETSGVLLVAKNERAGRELSLQFQHHLIVKTYAAVVEGVLPTTDVTVDVPLRRSASHSLCMTADEKSGKHALTHLVLERAFGHFSLLKAEPHTGRQHQIRVHLAALGYPLAVDGAYGRRDRLTGADFNDIVRAPKVHVDRVLLGRCPLHARRIVYRHPSTGLQMGMSAPTPPDMQEFLRLLGELDPAEASF
jgi:23S rRNA pseudouridine1911/1915/1917 synthase